MSENTNYRPTKKVAASGLAGAVLTIVVAVAQSQGVTLEDWMLVGLASVLKDAAAYMKREGYMVLEGDVREEDLEAEIHEPESDEDAVAARVAAEVEGINPEAGEA